MKLKKQVRDESKVNENEELTYAENLQNLIQSGAEQGDME